MGELCARGYEPRVRGCVRVLRLSACVFAFACVAFCVCKACAGFARSCNLPCGSGAAGEVQQRVVVGRSSALLSLLCALWGLKSMPCSGFVELSRAQFGSLCGFTCFTSTSIYPKYIHFFFPGSDWTERPAFPAAASQRRAYYVSPAASRGVCVAKLRVLGCHERSGCVRTAR